MIRYSIRVGRPTGRARRLVTVKESEITNETALDNLLLAFQQFPLECVCLGLDQGCRLTYLLEMADGRSGRDRFCSKTWTGLKIGTMYYRTKRQMRRIHVIGS